MEFTKFPPDTISFMVGILGREPYRAVTPVHTTLADVRRAFKIPETYEARVDRGVKIGPGARIMDGTILVFVPRNILC